MSAVDANTGALVAMAVIIIAARVVGWVMARIGQPRVLGEILAGILLGPSLLGAVWPDATGYLFSGQVLDALRSIAQIGLVLFMFLVGHEVDPSHLRGQGHKAIVISNASIAVPIILGATLGMWLYPRLGGQADRLGFVLFLGAAMSITAFPVLARILQEARLDTTRIGSLALACAAFGDVTAWCLLAGVVAIVNATGLGDMVTTTLMAVGYTGFMVLVIRPFLARRPPISLPYAVALALASAWLTEMIGIHAIFGAFIAGLVVPAVAVDNNSLTERMESITTAVLLPVFFVVVGLSTRVGLLNSVYLWGITGLITATAIVGKLGGSAIAARTVGESWKDSFMIGVLLNTRGLTELVILNVGLELGVISPTVFTALVVMALATTFMAGPLLQILRSSERLGLEVGR